MYFGKLGLTIEKKGDDIFIPAHKDGYEIQNYIDGSILTVADAPWPGFTPDLLSIVLVLLPKREEVCLFTKKCLRAFVFCR